MGTNPAARQLLYFPHPLLHGFLAMLAKKTTKNQITLPKKIIDHFPGTEYFDVREEAGHIVLVPLRPGRADEVREKLKRLGITETDVQDAVAWARRD
ncbi:MAG: AbrB/MazE/SpoVT family DNA-binding domain-containing protein [Chromatiales bacterium]|nr:AbrB/MazE/SpoVT family DNA-binding domain-containing protein [Chromatiales bacterium]MDX9766314.1 AbrB/MazE/SpoVT family DNA-binding domain-containing protein [Ectothiorhodospiraceae bacterium]